MPVRLDDEPARCGAAKRGRGFVRRADHGNRRRNALSLRIGSHDFDIAELVEPIDQALPVHAQSRRRDHVLAVACARGLAPAAARGGALPV